MLETTARDIQMIRRPDPVTGPQHKKCNGRSVPETKETFDERDKKKYGVVVATDLKTDEEKTDALDCTKQVASELVPEVQIGNDDSAVGTKAEGSSGQKKTKAELRTAIRRLLREAGYKARARKDELRTAILRLIREAGYKALKVKTVRPLLMQRNSKATPGAKKWPQKKWNAWSASEVEHARVSGLPEICHLAPDLSGYY